MASTYQRLNNQVIKLKTFYGQLNPPQPDDYFESIKKEAYDALARLNEYTAERTEQERRNMKGQGTIGGVPFDEVEINDQL